MEKFDLHFHGHEHSSWFLDATQHLRVEGGAVYDNSEMKNAYYWVVIDFGNKVAEIYARTFNYAGATGWQPVNIPGKIDNGVGKIQSLFRKSGQQETASPIAHKSPPTEKLDLPTLPIDLIKSLEDKFKLRWERHLYSEGDGIVQVFWPVRLRKPTAIHASQCFVAASLQKVGCCINLFIDNYGRHEHVETDFRKKINSWFSRAGGKYTDINIYNYAEFVESLCQERRETFEKLLIGEIHTDRILRISKIWHSTGDPESILKEIKSKRPRRLLAPASTWTCLRKLYELGPKNPIITLGG